MLFFCEYSAVPGTRRETVRLRIYTLHHTSGNRQDCIERWYAYDSELAGCIICECVDRAELDASLEPFGDLFTFRIRELAGEVNYEDLFGLPKVNNREPAMVS